MKLTTRRRVGIWLVAVFIGVLTTLCLWRLWLPGRSFDAAVWRADATTGSGVRHEMADRLLAQGTLIGKSSDEVVALLGDPNTTGYFDSDFVYWLGPERGFIQIDNEWLVLRFNTYGRVIEADLVTD